MSGRKLSLRHSVKHYEAISLNYCFISGGKDRYFYEMIDYFVAKSLIFLRKFGKTTANLEKSRIFAKKLQHNKCYGYYDEGNTDTA